MINLVLNFIGHWKQEIYQLHRKWDDLYLCYSNLMRTSLTSGNDEPVWTVGKWYLARESYDSLWPTVIRRMFYVIISSFTPPGQKWHVCDNIMEQRCMHLSLVDLIGATVFSMNLMQGKLCMKTWYFDRVKSSMCGKKSKTRLREIYKKTLEQGWENWNENP